MGKLLMLLVLAMAAKHEEKKLEKVKEYDLLPTCVENIVVNNTYFHCVVDDINKPTKMMCDGASFKVFLKKGSTVDNCTTIHMVFPKEGDR